MLVEKDAVGIQFLSQSEEAIKVRVHAAQIGGRAMVNLSPVRPPLVLLEETLEGIVVRFDALRGREYPAGR